MFLNRANWESAIYRPHLQIKFNPRPWDMLTCPTANGKNHLPAPTQTNADL